MTPRTQLVPVVGIGAAAAMIFNILPVFLGKAAESLALSDSATGWLAAAYLAGFGLSSVSASLWLHRFGRKVLARLLFLSAATLLAAVGAMQAIAAVTATLFAAGLVLGGLYTLSFVLAGEHPNPTRALGVKLGGEVALGALLLFLIPIVVYPAFGFSGMLVALAVVLVAMLPCTRLVRASGPAPAAGSTADRGHSSIPPPAVFALAALFLFTVGQAAVWSFVERAGVRADYDPAAVGVVLSVAVLLGGAASFLAGALSDRFGKTVPLLFAASLYLLAMSLFAFGTAFFVYASAVSLFFFAWLFALPYLISAIGVLDHSGRATSLVTACFAFGSMIGPALAGELLARGDFELLYLAGAVATAVAYAAILTAVRRLGNARRTG